MASPWTRRILTGAGILAVGGALAWSLWPQPVPVDIGTVARGSLTVTVDDDGIARVRDVYTVSSPLAGTMQRSPRRVGDEVAANQTVVAIIEPAAPAFLDVRQRLEAEAASKAAEAGVAFAEAQLREAEAADEFARNELERTRELASRGVVPARQHEQARTAASTAAAQLASARATLEVRRRELESARARLIGPEISDSVETETERCCVMLRAPVSGNVLSILHQSEAVVAAGTALIEIGDLDKIEIAAELLSSDAVRVRAGAAATIAGWGGEVLEATVRRIDPAAFTKVSALGIEEQRVRVVLDLREPPPAEPRLGHNYRVNVSIVVGRHDDVVLVPLGALFRHGSDWAVFAVEDGAARLKRVEIGARDAANAVATSGLEAGETIVLHPSDRVEDGVSVARRSEEAG